MAEAANRLSTVGLDANLARAAVTEPRLQRRQVEIGPPSPYAIQWAAII